MSLLSIIQVLPLIVVLIAVGIGISMLRKRLLRKKGEPRSKNLQRRSKEMSTRKRPISVTVIAWFEIVGSSISLFDMLSYAMPEPRQLLEALGRSVSITVLSGIVDGVISLVSGIDMLKGLNWGRLLCLCYPPISIVLTLLLYGFHRSKLFIAGLVLYIVVFVFLTRPAASTFFAGESSEKHDVEE